MAGKYKFVTVNSIQMTVHNICRKRSSIFVTAKFEDVLSFFADILSKSGKVEPILSSRRAISRPIDKLFPQKISIIYQLGYWQPNFSKPWLSRKVEKYCNEVYLCYSCTDIALQVRLCLLSFSQSEACLDPWAGVLMIPMASAIVSYTLDQGYLIEDIYTSSIKEF